MSIPKATFSQLIKEFKIKELFNELGWDNVTAKYPIAVDPPKDEARRTGGRLYSLTGIAQKKEFLILLCQPQDGGAIPDAAARKKIDNAITKLHFEHLIIYVDGKKTRQHWELMIREQNKPIVCRPIDYFARQEPELLFQKLEGLFFSYEDEDKLSIVDVRSRVMENFERNAEVVTKKFYEKFSKEHEKFLSFIKGIQSKVDQEWYASLMLNRLMFIYFIQKKGFLDNDRKYLSNRLDAVQKKRGKNKFYSFYRNFLLVLFHKGLGSPVRDAELEAEIGKVPYLNGGLFDVHKLEHDNKDISIEDKAFERIFDFFDEYNWHLDTRLTATGKDINPDVIGYIFEKYINDRAAMGAYYTKEDITEYISKNCIVPWLFDEAKRNYPKPFIPFVTASEAKQSDTSRENQIASVASLPRNDKMSIWSFFQQSGDTYIYPAVKYGVPQKGDLFGDVPEEIKNGFSADLDKKPVNEKDPHLFELRKSWNKPAPPEIALPTEIYRELIARRKRYQEVKQKIGAGEITEINDFITYNLNIRQFAQDVLAQTDDPKLIMEFYKAVKKITVLDPTCGSGAFLFAALNVLEPLYLACVTRMREFVEEHGKGKHKFFEDELKLIDSDNHPNEEYFIYKSIILHNLYGVDIMKEAVEIAKLRLFLKLVATVDVDYKKPNLGLEPLPDIDFNIRSGNTLVGYATLADLDKGEQGGLFGDEEKQAILEQMELVAMAYEHFKEEQTRAVSDPESYKQAKKDLENRLKDLNEKLNKYLAVTYLGPTHSKTAYEKWVDSHQPFHWLAEFYTTIEQGGFDVVIGNPPYLDLRELTQYKAIGYETVVTKNLYPMILERCEWLVEPRGRLGFIVPVSSVATEGYLALQRNLVKRKLAFSSFDDRPAHLFEGLDKNTLSILLLSGATSQANMFSTRLSRWGTAERAYVFSRLKYWPTPVSTLPGCLPKIETELEACIWGKLFESDSKLAEAYASASKHVTHYSRKVNAFLQILDFIPKVTDGKGNLRPPSEFKDLRFQSAGEASAVFACFNSSMFRWFMDVVSDGSHLNRREIDNFPFDPKKASSRFLSLVQIAKRLTESLQGNSMIRKMAYAHDTLTVQCIVPKHSKSIIDEIDQVLAKHYGFTEEELDFIINYDIKYRMGKELEE